MGTYCAGANRNRNYSPPQSKQSSFTRNIEQERNNHSGGGRGAGSGGSNQGSNPFYNGVTERVNGTYWGGGVSHSVHLSFKKGESASIYETRYNDPKPHGDFVGKTTYHPNGNVHYHGTHWHGNDGKDHGFMHPKKRS